MLASAQAACAASACPETSSYIIILDVSILLASFLVLPALLAVKNEQSRIPAHRSLP